MTATTLAPLPASRLSTVGIIRSEWIKLRTVRSTVWSYAIIVVVSIGMAVLMSSTIGGSGEQLPELQTGIVLQAATFGVYFGQLIVGVLGVLVISGEYSTGMIRSTLTAVPKRIPALAAKALVLFVATFVVGLVSTFGAFLVASPILANSGIEADLSDGKLYADLVLASLYLALTAVFSLGLGTVLRSSAGGIAAALGTILLLPTILQLIASFTQAQWAVDLMPYLFSNAGTGMFMESFDGSGFEQWQNTLVVVVWTAVSLVAGAVLIKRRDA
ncbi:ABC-2 type transport system permease protein [Conyzicola lurida]|uniref:ABC-2 type transport system permease protein n=1 Tax=Conyzicola lurida TaxID=1172621 RepID=A0A841AMP6_9MICO|nr:ABC transporter permease subunit [Conyzicola lurida]MBB5843604.1 ABC-2 type transport system permease protein [Conyzicola lurida]